ncbi:lipoprotein [Streptomyces sp. NPDC090106]|uniref:lipoprotein n=1 Tax=Streptomyces sp. NPDC090106 TaxID=3365946 RepID=UPI0037F5F6B8
MLVRAGNAGRRMAQVALLAGVLAGCSEDTGASGEKEDAKASASVSASASEGAVRGGTVGAAGSACLLPVGFDTAAEWRADALDGSSADPEGDGDGSGSGEDLAALLRQGPVSLVCEIDAKPAGHIGFLRVYTAEPGEDDAEAVLKAFVAGQDGTDKARYSSFEADGLTGAEVSYLSTSELLEETKPEAAFAVVTPDGPVVVHLGGMDEEEHKDMLPAFELAKRTLHTV